MAAAIEKKMWSTFPTCNRFSPRSSSTRFVSFLKAFGWTSRILQYWTKIFWRFVISSWNNVTVQNWPVVTIRWTARWRYQNESSSLSSIIIISSSVIRMRRIVSACKHHNGTFPNVISVEEILFENLNKTVVSEDLEVVAPHVQNLGARLNVIGDWTQIPENSWSMEWLD